MSEYEPVTPSAEGQQQHAAAEADAAESASTGVPRSAEAPVPPAAAPQTPVAAALRELDTLGERDLAEHPDVYQRIHSELQSALASIDNA